MVDSEKLLNKYDELLTDDEIVEIGFKLDANTYVFTNKRLILISKQGVAENKLEYISIGYNRIVRFSIETSGGLELDAELKIWVEWEPRPTIVQKFDKSVNVYQVQKILTKYAF